MKIRRRTIDKVHRACPDIAVWVLAVFLHELTELSLQPQRHSSLLKGVKDRQRHHAIEIATAEA